MLAFESDTYIPIVWTFNGSNWESYNISNPDFTPYFTLGNSIYATTQGLLIGGYDQNNVAKVYLFNPINGFNLYTTPQCDAYNLTVNNGHLVTMSQSSNYPDYQLCLAELNNGTWTDISPTVNTGLPTNSYYLNLTSINNSATISGASDMYGDNMNNISPSMLSYTTPNWTAQSTPPRENGHILLSSTQNKFGTIYAAALTNSFPDGVTLGTATISKSVNGAWTLVNVPFLNGLNTNLIDLYPDNFGNIYATVSYFPAVSQYPIITTILVESAPQ